jgi:hypothetical protein
VAWLQPNAREPFGSAAFKPSRRHRRLLEYLVRHTLDGRKSALEEPVLAA